MRRGWRGIGLRLENGQESNPVLRRIDSDERPGSEIRARGIQGVHDNSTDGRIHYLLGRTYQQAGQAEKARQAMEIFRQRRQP